MSAPPDGSRRLITSVILSGGPSPALLQCLPASDPTASLYKLLISSLSSMANTMHVPSKGRKK